MHQAFKILEDAVNSAKANPSVAVEVVECNVGLDRNGEISESLDAPIQLRIVAYPRHAETDSAKC